MLLVVQRVRAHTGEEGVNRFAYLAGEQNWSDPRSALDADPSMLLIQSTPIEAGGNLVRSYLDVAFPDNYTREQVTWILSTIPRVDDFDSLPYESSLGDAAWRFNAVLDLVPLRQVELGLLADEAYALAMSWLDRSQPYRADGLNDAERVSLALGAARGNTGATIDFLRALAANGRISAMFEAIEAHTSSVDTNRAGVRNFLQGRIPGILSNSYLNTLGPRRYNKFIDWSLKTPDWGDAIRKAAGVSGRALQAEVDRMLAQAGAT